MNYLHQRLPIILDTALLFLTVMVANEWLFPTSEYAPGANWIFLPAGVRLLGTLIFAEAGAIGILCGSLLSCLLLYFPHDPARSFFHGIISAIAPYLVYLFARRVLGLEDSLNNLTVRRLLFLIVLYASINPALHQLCFALRQEGVDGPRRFVVMVVGDLSGSLIVLYAMKLALRFVSGNARRKA